LSSLREAAGVSGDLNGSSSLEKSLRYAVVHLPGESGGAVKDAPAERSWLRHSACALMGLRPALAQHTAQEHAAFRKWAAGCKCVVEIGVAEGVSALALREGGKVVWIEKFSESAARSWNESIDLLLIDGDHAEAAVERDWHDWGRFVRPGGAVIFHDARIFQNGWTSSEYGPVRFVDRFFRSGGAPDWTIVEEIHSLFVVQRNK
jgi:hypothetical protein